jgi:superfamily II DNA helicase RecQ
VLQRYIVPLIAIIKTLERELSKFKIKYEILDSDHNGQIKHESKVIIVTPEKLMNKITMQKICQLSWSALVIDEPHYILQWGTSKKK